MFELNDELAICLFTRTIRRLHPLRGKIPKEYIQGLNEFQHVNFYPSLTQDQIDKIDDFIDHHKDEIMNGLFLGIMQADNNSKHPFSFEAIRGLLGVDTNELEFMEKTKRLVAQGKVKVKTANSKEFFDRIFSKDKK